MSHPFGDLLSQHLHRKHGLSQSKLAAGVLQDPAVIGKMCKGQRLVGSQARTRVLAIISWLHGQAALTSIAEANALLAAAGMLPLQEADAAEREIQQQLRAESVSTLALPVAPARRMNLPALLTSFVGRSDEVTEIACAVRQQRLLTLTGAGGVGKTRLALEVGRRLVQENGFGDGIWLVELAALNEPALVAPTMARLFNLLEQPERPALEVLQAYLADKHLLLILDNCEHLIEACAKTAERLLQHCWQLHILATSREEMRIPGEGVYPVLPLTLPGPAVRAPDQVLASAAVQLFIARMGRVPHRTALQEEEVALLGQICRQLDGIPLALELAAPLTHSMPLAQIVTQLADQMAVLTNRYRTAIPRHHTMHSALVWSYRLLAPPEQQLLARLSVFWGGWTLEAMQDVCADEDRQEIEHDLSAALEQLIATSWVLVEQNLSGPRRYRLLEPVRQFAQAQLVARTAQQAMRRRHARYFLALAEQLEHARDTPYERAWLDRLEPERANMRAVNEWALERQDAEFAQRFNGSLFAFWNYRSNLTEANHWLRAAVALQTPERTPSALAARALALAAAGYVVLCQDAFAEAQRYFAQKLQICAELDDARGVADALRGSGFTAMARGDLLEAQQLVEQALTLSRSAQDAWGVAWATYDLGFLAWVRQDLPQARALLTDALGQLRGQGISWGAFRALIALGHVMRALGDLERAQNFYQEALRLQQSMRYVINVADALEGLAGLVSELGDPMRAAQLFGAAQAHRKLVTEIPRWHLHETRYERDVASVRSHVGEEAWHANWAAGYAMSLEQAVVFALAE